VLAHAAALAGKFGGNLTLLYVVDISYLGSEYAAIETQDS
jgi:nucleotide-binding universal stress UspA family protein